MKIMKVALLTFIIPLFFMRCENLDTNPDEISATESQLTGSWVLKSVFLGDAVDTPCGWEAGEKVREMTLNFTTEKTNDQTTIPNAFVANGQSSVNSFFTSFTVNSFDAKTMRGKVTFGGLGSTKMAGSPALMQCEQRYFGLITDATDFQILNDNGKLTLQLGRLKEPGSAPSRDGGTYLILEKAGK